MLTVTEWASVDRVPALPVNVGDDPVSGAPPSEFRVIGGGTIPSVNVTGALLFVCPIGSSCEATALYRPLGSGPLGATENEPPGAAVVVSVCTNARVLEE
jgi:hypothetical protein